MAPSHLIACPGCARHLRVSETACPFCKSALDEGLRARPAPRPPAMRLSRAALFALGTATGASALACSSSSTPQTAAEDSGATGSGDTSGGGTGSSFDVMHGTHYGSSAHTTTGESDESSDISNFSAVALYGATGVLPDEDAGPASSSGSEAKDAGVDARAVGVDAAYGGPPVDEGFDGSWLPEVLS